MSHTHIGKHPKVTIEQRLDNGPFRFCLRLRFDGMRIAHKRPPHTITPYGLHLTLALDALEGVKGVVKFDDRTILVFLNTEQVDDLNRDVAKAINGQGYTIEIVFTEGVTPIEIP